MAWTAELLSAQAVGAMIEATVRFSDGKGNTRDERTHGDDLNAAQLRAWVKARIASLTARDAALATLAPGPITDPAPDQAEIDARAFFVNLAALNDMARLVGKKLKKENDQDYVDLTALISAALRAHPEYQKDPRFT